MRVATNQKHLSMSEELAEDSNRLAKNFNAKGYAKIENIDSLLLKRDISVEKKKSILIDKLYSHILKAFSADKKKFGKNAMDSMKKRLGSIRKIVDKLRGINYYLETIFLEDLKLAKIKVGVKSIRLMQESELAKDELEVLEYTTYQLIGKAVVLDKRLLSEYAERENRILGKEKIEISDLESVLAKESRLFEHLEAKLPPPAEADMRLVKEPIFTHWVARIFAILSLIKYLYSKEKIIFGMLKKNRTAKIKISKKITHLMKEKSKLLEIMEEKATSMKTNKNLGFLVPRKSRRFSRGFRLDENFKKELHNLTTIVNL